ncbi:MAG TPA: DNA mismatch repair protein MutS [Chloroflexi bacterium]|nr:DNA mismatch repair protein MutS [Chloroflexota bacterium]
MTFCSILFENSEGSIKEETVKALGFFVDLNLDQVIAAITSTKQEYNLEPFFYTPLSQVKAIQYRQEIARDLENETLKKKVDTFAEEMSVVRRYLALVDKLYYQYHKEGWFLEAVQTYCSAVTCLVDDLNHANLQSRGLLAVREYLTNYANSSGFTSLLAEAKKIKAGLSTIKYCVIIKDSTVKVRKYEAEIDYSVEVEKTFEKFKQGAVKDYRLKLAAASGMNHVEAQILNLVAKLHPEIFARLDDFCVQHSHFLDETIRIFDREIQFYIAYLEYISKIKRSGLTFCYPQISQQSKEIYDYDGFDLALAAKCVSENSPIICNDFCLKGQERILVVSGPNQGGKTTFARTFGQLHYLASLGCPVPCVSSSNLSPPGQKIFIENEPTLSISGTIGRSTSRYRRQGDDRGGRRREDSDRLLSGRVEHPRD